MSGTELFAFLLAARLGARNPYRMIDEMDADDSRLFGDWQQANEQLPAILSESPDVAALRMLFGK